MSIAVADSLFNTLGMCSTPPIADSMFPNSRWKEATPDNDASFDRLREAFSNLDIDDLSNKELV